MKCIRILFLLLIFPKLAFTQQDIDSTLLELNQQLKYSDTKLSKINALLEIGNYQISREFNKAESYFLDAKNIIESSQDNYENQLAFIYTKLGVINRRKGNYGNAITLYYKAKVIYEKLKDTSKLGEVIHNTAMLNRFQGDDKKAINNYKKSLSYSLKMKDTFNTAAAYNMMGVSYRRLKLIDSALTSYKKAKKLFQLLNNEEEIRGVNNNMATLYSIQKLYKKSLPIKLDNYPNLTKSEREVCGLLRVNLSIKEVASIRNTSIDSIKSIRYRLRKKMNLDKNIELEKFIQSL